MLPNLFRLTLLLTLTLALLIGAIRAQPYDDSELRAFLFPEGCSVACIMGIRPSVTTRDEAVVTLREHHWVEKVDQDDFGISWEWSDKAPPFINLSIPGNARVNTSKQVIDVVRVASTVPLSDFLLFFGHPLQGDYSINGRFPGYVISAIYPNRLMSLYVTSSCPVTTSSVLREPAIISWESREHMWYRTGTRNWQGMLTPQICG